MADTHTQSESINWADLGEDDPSLNPGSTSPVQHDKGSETIKSFKSDKPGQVIGCTGVKGGLGTTTVALNLAMSLVQTGHRVIFLELSPHPGTVTAYLDQTPNSSVRLAELTPSDINAEILAKLTIVHSSGLEFIYGSLWSQSHRLSSDLLESLFQRLTTRTEYVIVDFPLESSPITECILQHCHLVNVIADTDRVCLETAQQQLSFLKKEGYPHIFLTVVNRTGMPPADGLKGIQDQLGCQALALIPSATELCFTAVTKNLPIVCNNPNSLPAIQFFQMRDHILAYLTGEADSLQQDRRAKDRRKQNRREGRDGW